MFEEQIIELTKLNGVILKKAELENNFTSVYSEIFEKMDEIRDLENFAGEEFLLLLGNVGG